MKKVLIIKKIHQSGIDLLKKRDDLYRSTELRCDLRARDDSRGTVHFQY
mgnify:CR=1 FL=1